MVALTASPLLTDSARAAELVFSEFSNSGFSWLAEGFTQQTGSSQVRLQDASNGWGVAGLNQLVNQAPNNRLDLTSWSDAYWTIDASVNALHGANNFTMELVDQTGITGKWSFGTGALTGGPQNLVSATTLAQPTGGIGDFQNLDLSNITSVQVLGDFDNPAPFSVNFDRIAISDAVEPVPYLGAESDAAWRTDAVTMIDQNRRAALDIQVRGAGTGSNSAAPGAVITVQQQEHAFGFGSAVAARLVTDASPLTNETYRQKVDELFNYATLENAYKWEPWEGDWGPNFGQNVALTATQWLNDQDIDVRGHNMVWPGYNDLPNSMKSLLDQYEATSNQSQKDQLAAQMQQAVLDHIADLGTQTAGTIVDWDVVNETRANHDLQDILGEEVLATWFAAAAAASPDADLYLNDYGILTSADNPNTVNQQILIDTILDIQADGGPIDGVGLQSHFTPDSLSGPETLWAILDRFQNDTGLDIQITEFDFATADEALQAQYTRDFMTAVFAHEAVTDFIAWGFWEDAHWRPDAAMFRSDWSIKANGEAYMDLVFNEWWTDEAGLANGAGDWALRAYEGQHQISVTYEGIEHLYAIELLDDLTFVAQLADGHNGALDAQVINRTGTLRLGGPNAGDIGILNLTGAYTQESGGTLVADVRFGAGDALVSAGTVSLAGTLVLNAPSAVPTLGYNRPLILGNEIEGTFDMIQGVFITDDLYWAVTYSDNIVTVTAALPGDANLDGEVSLLDLDILGANWSTAGSTWIEADFNGDGITSLLDLDILGAHWGDGSTSFAAALAASGITVPEPATAGIALMGLLAISRRRSA